MIPMSLSLEAFAAKTAGIAYVERGMFFSEVYLFTCWCLAKGVTRIIESGVRNGLSTRLLHALWPGQVISVELKRHLLPARFAFPVVIGDGRGMVPALIADYAPEPVGVLLDGPKGVKGSALRDHCLALPTVRVVGLHDAPSDAGETMHSHDLEFAQIGHHLDARVPVDVRARYPLHRPGLGVWVAA